MTSTTNIEHVTELIKDHVKIMELQNEGQRPISTLHCGVIGTVCLGYIAVVVLVGMPVVVAVAVV